MKCSGLELFDRLRKTILESGVLEQGEEESGMSLHIALSNFIASIFYASFPDKEERKQSLHKFLKAIEMCIEDNDKNKKDK